jgi:hypothetical protein
MRSITLLFILSCIALSADAQKRKISEISKKDSVIRIVCGTKIGIAYYIDGVRVIDPTIWVSSRQIAGSQSRSASPDPLLLLPQRNINSIANTIVGVDSRAGEAPNIRGCRADGTAYYIDGMRVRWIEYNVEDYVPRLK